MAGLVAAVGWAFALVRLLDGPGVDATEDEILRFYSDPDVGWDTFFVLQILFVATAGFLWFVGVIRKRVGISVPKLFDAVFFGGGILLAGLMFVGAAALAAPFVLADLGGVAVDPSVAAMTRSFAQVTLEVFTPRIAALAGHHGIRTRYHSAGQSDGRHARRVCVPNLACAREHCPGLSTVDVGTRGITETPFPGRFTEQTTQCRQEEAAHG